MSKLKYKKIVIFGPPGSGKGTQADALADKFGVPHICTGDIFRKEIAAGTKIGKIAETINEGNFVPDEVAIDVVKKRLTGEDVKNNFILDGFPRNVKQAKFLDETTEIDLALEILISDDEAVMRVGGRRTCPKCGEVYHLKFNPPKQEGVCDNDGKKLVHRADDREKKIRIRLEKYHQQTEPLVEYYRTRGIYQQIDGMPEIPEVTREILKIVGD